jgi:diguanylate cyclase (GGDEF)-like protein
MGAQIVAESLRRAVEGLQVESGGEPMKCQISISVGVASDIPKVENRPESLVDRADRALYQAKDEGRNRVHLASQIA